VAEAAGLHHDRPVRDRDLTRRARTTADSRPNADNPPTAHSRPTAGSRPAVEDRPLPPVATVRIGGVERLAPLIAAALATFLALGLLKPWSATPGATPSPAFGPPGNAAATPSADLGSLPEHCQDPLGWRVYTREQWPAQDVRTWRAIVPASVAPDGPLDAALPVMPILSRIEALGYCSPWAGPERPPDASRLTVWRIIGSGGDRSATPITTHLVAPAPASVLGVLLAPPPSVRPGDSSRLWPDGEFVFALRGGDWERWWAVDVAIPVLAASPRSPGASPSSAGASTP
jgi:hypothetical protein